MKIKLLKPYQGREPGSIVDFSSAISELLIQRTIAEPVIVAEHPKRTKKRRKR